MVVFELFHAAETGDIEFLKQCNDQTLNDSVCDNQGRNCLHYAARRGGVDLLKYLVEDKRFTGNKRSNVGATAAHDAAAAGNIEALKWLLQYGKCNIDDQDGTGATILHLACRFQHTNVTEWLLDTYNIDVSSKTASGGLALHFAVVGGDYDAVKLLLDYDRSTVNLTLSNGATSTYLAAQEGHLEILRLLIQDYKGNIRMKSYDGMSCLHAAAQSGHLDCVRFLVDEEKCNVNERDYDGATPLHFAASQGHYIVIDWLMKVGNAVVTLDNLGGSPLHNAAECNQIECVKVLISNGCSTEITDNNGLTATQLAKQCYHEHCAEVIETFQPNSAFVIDDDVAYLHSVQSPRVNTLNVNGHHHGYVTTNSQPPYIPPLSLHNGFDNNVRMNGNHGDRMNGDTGYHGNLINNQYNRDIVDGHGSHAPTGHVHKVRPPSPTGGVYIADEIPDDINDDVKQTEIEDYMSRVRRNNSTQWSIDAQIDTENNSLSESSLSNDDDTTEHRTNNRSQQQQKQHPLVQVQPYTNNKFTKPDVQMYPEKRNVKFDEKIENIPNSSRLDESSFTDRSDFGIDLHNGMDNSTSNGFVKPASGLDDSASDGFVKRASPTMYSENHSVSVNREPVLNHVKIIPPSVSNKDSTQETSGIPNPPVPPPVPPPAPPININLEPKNNSTIPDDVKRKTASLPAARSQTIFTPDMIQSKRSTLTPVNKNNNKKQQSGMDTDFLAELKKATQGAGFKKTNNVQSEPGAKPIVPTLEFKSGARKMMNGDAGNKKDKKVELTGEWDPKNFYDKVPNHDMLPAWKLQLLARQIAEKEMKETLEKRQIDKHESRFKNMPAWKRALLEKKEAEMKASEEKKMKELEQQKPANVARKKPTVNVVGKSGEDENNLAPWQRELKKK